MYEAAFLSTNVAIAISFHLQLDQRDDGDEIQKVMGELTGATSVPRVFVGGKFIGASRNVGPG